MERLTIIFYIIAFSFFVALGTYNWFYGHQVEKAKYLLGLSPPKGLKKLLALNVALPFTISLLVLALTFLAIATK